MDIKRNNIYTDKPTQTSIAQYVEGELEDPEGGAIESAAGTVRNATQALGRLLNVLVTKNIVLKEELVHIVEGYYSSRDNVELVESDV